MVINKMEQGEEMTKRQWGYYKVLYENSNEVKVKELVVLPGKKLSMQKHFKRAEHWFIVEGVATVYTVSKDTELYEKRGIYKKHESLHIDLEQWHQLANEQDINLKIVEIQYGTNCIEEDIIRK